MATKYSLLDACAFKCIIELRLLPTVDILFVTPQNTALERLICTARNSADELKTYLKVITHIDLCDKHDIGEEGVKVLADTFFSNRTITNIAIISFYYNIGN